VSLKRIIGIIFAWRMIITLIAVLSIVFFPFKPAFPYSDIFFSDAVYKQSDNRLLTSWAHFDGVHYLSIISYGYANLIGHIQAFFPLYPMLVKILSLNIIHPISVGVALSTTSLVVGLRIFYKLIRLDESTLTAKRSILLLLLFPTSFFFTSMYTEGLFFLLVVSSFYLMRKERWFWAGLIGALASMTRLVGIFLLPAILYEYWQFVQGRGKGVKIPELLWSMLPTLGLGLYMYYLYVKFSDPLLFAHVQSDFGTSRETNRIILLYQVFYRYLKMLITVDKPSLLYYSVVNDFLAGILGTLMGVMSWIRLRRSYAIYAVLSFITPTLTGTFSSLPRYLLVIFPFFILLARIQNKYILRFIYISFGLLQVINILLFVQGKWVA